MWRKIAQSLSGPSHAADGSACQDSHLLQVIGEGGAETLVAAVADGAGSARFSDIGSAIACATIVDSAVGFFAAGGRLEDLGRDDAVRWCTAARERIEVAAAARDCAVRELATTLCAAIVGPTYSTFFQIGDGAMVLRQNGTYGVVFWPQSGEYANSTNFLTSDQFDGKLEFVATDRCCSDLALMTDGLERLALRFDGQTPHAPFFDPFFRALREADDATGLNSALQSFLESKSVRERTDDDTTLILASRIVDDAEDAA